MSPARKGGRRPEVLTAVAVVRRLRVLDARSERPLRWDQIPSPLKRAIFRCFGSLDRARVAARIRRLEPPRKWTLALVLRALRRAHARRIPIKVQDLRDAGLGDLVSAVGKYTGTLSRARRLAGIKPPARRPYGKMHRWDADSVCYAIRDLSRRGEPLATSRVALTLYQAGTRYFGSWRNAVEASGLDYDAIRLYREWTDEKVFVELRKLARKNPHLTFRRAAPRWLRSVVQERFGSIDEAVRRAGIRGWAYRERFRVPDRAGLLRAVRARHRAGRSLVPTVVRKEDPHLDSAVLHRFASWAEALAAARVRAPKVWAHWDRGRVLAALRARRSRGASLEAGAVHREDLPLYSAACAWWGSYVAAARRVDPSLTYSKWSRAKVRAELRRLADRVGLASLPPALRRGCERYFGSIDAAFRAAGVRVA